jgi:hypothetical protein
MQAIVRDVGPGGRWPTLTKTNYVEWAAVMRVRLQMRHMWEAVRYGDIDYYEDRRALDALIGAVLPEMQFSLSKKRTVKEAWDAIAATRIGSDRARKTTLQALRKEWENLALPVHPREVQADRLLNRVSAGPLRDVDRRGDRSPQGRRWRRTTASLGAYHRRREVTSHSGTVGGLPG